MMKIIIRRFITRTIRLGDKNNHDKRKQKVKVFKEVN